MRQVLEDLSDRFVFHTSPRFDLLPNDHVPYVTLGASDVDSLLRRAIERAGGVIAVVGRMGSGKSSLIASVAENLDAGFVPLRVSVIGIEAGDAAAFARHAITEISGLPDAALTKREERALARASASGRTESRSRELRAGFSVSAGTVLTPQVLGDLTTAASEELNRPTDPAETMRGIQRLLDKFWKVGRCPVLLVEDTDHWGDSPQTADRFFDQTARAFTGLDCAMVVATQNEYTALTGSQRIRDRLTAEVLLPRLTDVESGLSTLLEHRMRMAEMTDGIGAVMSDDAVRALADSYRESSEDDYAGDIRRTVSVMRAAVDIALSDPIADSVTVGHLQEAKARTPLAPPSRLA